jgi:multidrug resistance efflux pump
VRLGSKVGGRVEAVKVKEGDVVNKDDPMVIFAVPELRAQRAQLKARLDLAIADWQKAESGPRQQEKDAAREASKSLEHKWDLMVEGFREEEKRQAKNDMEASDTDRKLAKQEFERIDRLYQQNSASKSDWDTARATLERSEHRYEANRAKYEMMMNGNRPDEIKQAHAAWQQAEANYALLMAGTRQEEKDAAKAAVDEAQGKLNEIDANLKEAEVLAPNRAVIEVLGVRAGDVVAPNVPVVRILSAEDLWVKVYVPETELGRVRLHQNVKVTIDSYPGQELEGEVVQIAAASEFTPRNVQSADERKHQVFGVKVRVADPKGILKSGMAAEVVIPLKGLAE